MAKVIIKKTPEAKSGSKLSAAKAREILHDGTVHGKKLTEKQRRFFGWKASQKAEDGTTIPIDNNTIQFSGKSHAKGGMDITYGGQTVEVEGGETGYQSPVDDSLHIMGNMINPITGKKFKQDSKNLASKERKMEKLLDESFALIIENDPFSKWGMLKFNAGAAMGKGAIRKKREIASSKEWLATLQNAMLEKSEELGVDPQSFSKGKLTKAKYGKMIKAQNGANIDPGDDYIKIAKAAATKYGVDPNIILRLMRQESTMNPSAKSDRDALGIMQFVEGTAKQYGVEKILRSRKPEDVAKVIDAGVRHFADLTKQFNGDTKLALMAYNGGPGFLTGVKGKNGKPDWAGAINIIAKRLGKPTSEVTGDEVMDLLEERRANQPTTDKHAWQNETYDYVNIIANSSDKEFPQRADKFRNFYYSPDYDKIRQDIKKKYNIDLPNNPTIIENVKNYVDKYNPDRVQVQDYTLSLQEPKQYDRPTNARNLSIEQILPELYTMASNKVEPVWMQQYDPQLYQPYNVTFQDRLNENQATFSALTRAAKDNPSALASLAAQKYLADSGVLGEEFRTNQAIEADITNKNIALLNDAQLKNLDLADRQYVRQSEAKSKTRAQNIEVLKSVSDKLVLNRYEQMTQGIYENLYPHYTFDPDSGAVQKIGAPGQEYLNWQGNDNMGMTGDQKVSTTYDPATGQPKRINVTTQYPTVTELNEQRLREQKATSVARRLRTNLNIFGSYPLWNRKR